MKGWFIGVSKVLEDAVVRTKTDTEFVPTDGWEYFKPRDKRGNWRDDPTVTVIPGPMETCEKINISGEVPDMFTRCLGVFSTTGNWCSGKPVFSNNSGGLLICLYDHWILGHTSSIFGDKCDKIEGCSGASCPTQVNQWYYMFGGRKHVANIKIRARGHFRATTSF